MGYGGKVTEQRRARELRAQSWTIPDIAKELGVSKSSVSLWVRDVDFVPNPRRHNYWTKDNPHPMQLAKEAEIERCHREGVERIGALSDREFLVLGLALYAGEGAKTDGSVRFANSDPRLILVFVTWLRRFFEIEESRLRIRLYLARRVSTSTQRSEFWSHLTANPGEPVRQAVSCRRGSDDPDGRSTSWDAHASIYSCALTHRRVMGMIEAVTSTAAIPG